MKKITINIIILCLFMLAFENAEANTAPALTRGKPENVVTDTITIVKGQTITFSVAGTDVDGNMRGIEWYNNSYIGADSFTQTGSKTMTKAIVFNTAGNYNVSCVAFDALNAYGNGIAWKVKVVEFSRCAYVDWGDEVAGNSRAEDTLINWAVRNKINGFAVYVPAVILRQNHTELNTFIGKAKANGINEVSFVIGNGTTDLTAALSYYDDPTVTNKFNGLLTEIEYWGAGTSGSPAYEAALTSYIQVLTDMKNASNARGPGFKVECYMGGGQSQSEADRLCAVADKILLVCYTSSTDPQSVYYTYRRDRLQYFLNAAVNNGRKIEIKPLFSLEPNFQGGQSLSTIDNSFFGGFTTDNNLTNKYKKGVLSGAQYFTYYYMNSNKLYAPRQNYLSAVGYSGDTIKVEQNGAIVFKTEANDQNGNFSGADWYVNGVLHGQENITPATIGTVRHTITFDTLGVYTIEARLRDATGLFTPQGFLMRKIVEVTDSLVNLAKGKVVSQSTTVFGGVPERAVDGNPTSSWAGGSLSHTSDQDPNTQAWWQVDLGDIKNISVMKIFNRTDCCSERLSNFHVFVSDVPFTSNTVTATQAQTGVSDFLKTGNFPEAGDVNINRTGRYIRIQLTTAGVPLSLAEVKVYEATTIGSQRMVVSKTMKQEPILDSLEDTDIKIYPNPVASVLYVNLLQEASLFVSSLDGKKITIPITVNAERTEIDTRSLSSGLYLLQIQLKDTTRVFKFVKK